MVSVADKAVIGASCPSNIIWACKFPSYFSHSIKVPSSAPEMCSVYIFAILFSWILRMIYLKLDSFHECPYEFSQLSWMICCWICPLLLPVMMTAPFLKHCKQLMRCFGGFLPQRATATAKLDCGVAVMVLKWSLFIFFNLDTWRHEGCGIFKWSNTLCRAPWSNIHISYQEFMADLQMTQTYQAQGNTRHVNVDIYV